MSTSKELIERRKDILGGTPVFKGTRVPFKTFFEYFRTLGSPLKRQTVTHVIQ